MADKIEDLAQLRENLVDDIELRHTNRLNIALENLERDVVKIANDLPTRKGKLFEARLAVEIRPKLKEAIDKHYLLWADNTVREYDKVAKQIVENMKVLPIPDKFKTLTEIDIQTITNLKRLKFNGFLDIATETTNALADNVYSSTIAGKSFNDMQKELQQRINGVYINADVDEINELVEFVATTTDEVARKKAIDRLHTFYGADRTGENMRRYSKQLAHDSLMEFDGQFTKAKATEAGLTNFLYYGDIIGDSRPFCIANRGKIFSEDELRDKWSSESWKGKSTSDPFISRGGYNCRHHLQPTDPSWYDADGNLILDEEIGTATKVKTVTDDVKPKQKSIVPDVAIASLLSRGSPKIRKAYQDDFNSQLTDQQKRIVERYPKPSEIKNSKRGRYYSESQTVSAPLNASGNSKFADKSSKKIKSFVIAHEYGHHIDNVSYQGTRRFWSESNADFSKAINKDKRRFKGTSYKSLKTGEQDGYFVISNDELKTLAEELRTKRKVDYIRKGRKISEITISELKEDGFGEVSDIIDALSSGRFRKNYNMWGHSESYWRRQGAVESEIFANLFAIRHNKKAYDLAKKYIPNTVKEFEKRLIQLETGTL